MILTEEDVLEVRKLLTTKCVIEPPAPFNFRPQTWKKWKRRYRRYLDALEKSLCSTTCIPLNDDDRIKLLIYLLGEYAEETFAIIERNIGWTFDDSLEQTIERLNQHFRRMINIKNNIYVRLNFHRRMQLMGQSITEFIKAIKFLAEPCNFGQSYDMMMRDKMVIGILCDATREKMFAFDDMLTFDRACTIAFNEELRNSRRPG